VNEGQQSREVRNGIRVLSWVLVALVVAGLLALVFFLPFVLVIVFLVLLAAAAGIIVKREGAMKGVVYFVKEILFGW
jgi:hypothetical protein